ncbi:MAG: reductive dehalogenase domain-containing protein [bacterium]
MNTFSLELNLPDLLLVIIGLIIFISFITVAVISLFEKEKRAALRAFAFALLFPMPYFVIGFLNIFFSSELSWAVFLITAFVALLILLPIDLQREFKFVKPSGRIDERDVMFSRNELVEGTARFKDYYKKNPSKKSLDDKFRSAPGLLMPGSTKYDPFMFASADATFETIESLKAKVEGETSPDKTEVEPTQISNYIKNWARYLGAVDVGVTELKDYHLYSHMGRGERYGKEVSNNHKFAIAFIVEMDFDMVKRAPAGPIVMESAKEYLHSGILAVQVANFIRRLGYNSRAHIDGNYQVVCPLVAKDAGLGEIGRIGLLMNSKLGPRLRISVVTTDMPLVTDKPGNDSSVVDFCMKCKKCAVACPSRAIPLDTAKNELGELKHWQINQEACFTYWCNVGTDCGRCLAVCPYSHPNNFLHDFVRWGIKNSYLFRQVAVKFDDLLYGKRPSILKLADWMNISK